jgi:hypothetical protein
MDYDEFINIFIKANFEKLCCDLNIESYFDHDFVEKLKNSDKPFDLIINNIWRDVSEEDKLLPKRIFKNRMNDYAQELKKKHKICSFSERNDSILMWSHYADYHKGFCIEYSIADLPCDSQLPRSIFPVIYSPKLYDLTSSLIHAPNDNYNILSRFLLVLRKSEEWKYQREWRLVNIAENPNPHKMPTPTAIYLGAKIAEDDKECLLDIASKKNIQHYNMSLSTTEFKMTPK